MLIYKLGKNYIMLHMDRSRYINMYGKIKEKNTTLLKL